MGVEILLTVRERNNNRIRDKFPPARKFYKLCNINMIGELRFAEGGILLVPFRGHRALCRLCVKPR